MGSSRGVRVRVGVCFRVGVFGCVFQCVCLFVRLSGCLFVSLSWFVCRSDWLFVCKFVWLFVCSFVCVCMFGFVFLSASVSLPVLPFLCCCIGSGLAVELSVFSCRCLSVIVVLSLRRRRLRGPGVRA